ncbi:MAG: MFS transporter [Spirochaetales bacterium]
MKGPFAAFPRNTRNSLRLEPLWALFGGVIFYFAPLYMKALGVTELEMGVLTSVGLFLSFFFLLLAGPVTNKYGRHIACLVWDIVSWTVSMTLWAFAQNYLWFLVAVLFNSATRVTMISWNLLVTEDATQEQQVSIFAVVTLLGQLGGIVSLGAGLLLDTFGVIPTMRATYALGAVFMTSMFVLRYFFTQETENGVRVRELTRHTPLAKLVVDQGRSLLHAAKDGHFAVLALVFILNMAVQSFTFFQILRLRETLGYTNTELAIIPAVNSVLTLLLFSVVIPRVPAQAERLGLAVAFLLCAASAAAFLFLGPGMLVVVLVVQGLGAAAYVLLATYRDSVFMNSVPEEKKAELYSLLHMISMVASIPTGVLAGWLYTLNPLATFGAVVVLFVLGFVASLVLMRHQTAKHPAEPGVL